MGNVENGMKYGEECDCNAENRVCGEKDPCALRREKDSAVCHHPGLIRYFVVFFLTVMALGISMSVLENRLVQREVAGKVWRFHVVGDDDSVGAQAAKMLVTQQMLEWLAPRLSDCRGRDEAVRRIGKLLPQAEEKVKGLAASLGYTAAVSLTCTTFPAKTYGPYTLPAGLYDALEIRIGRAGGANWWCILYPGLCFSSDSFSDEMDSLLRELLSEDSYRQITSGSRLNELLSVW
ncbi:MAG TPA: hypothetical protein DF613_16160 [Lachnospiraceae bacterium]|nr:hypothetical protein [Lachnospiraceae bacterium]